MGARQEQLANLLLAAKTGAKVEIVSEDTEEGQQFKHIGGVGALLRFVI